MNATTADTAAKSAATGRALRGRSGEFLVLLSILAALGLWWESLASIEPEDLDDFGLASILPWQYWAALLLLSAGFSLSLYTSTRAPALRLAALAALVVLLHATPAIVYETLRYSWAWKHIGIVDYIQRHGEVNRTIPFLAAYHNWPGFFWISAKMANLFDWDPIQLANLVRFFPVVSNLVFFILLRHIYTRFTDDPRLIYAALWIFVCANWVGQDYFSPQAFAYSLHLLVLALCLGPLMPNNPSARTGLSRWIWRVRTTPAGLATSTSTLRPLQKIVVNIVVFICIVAVAASHQLTPLILAISLLGLSALTPLSFSYPVLALLALLFWLSYPAAPFTAAYLPSEVAQLGNTFEELTDKLVDTSLVNKGVTAVVWAGRVLSALVALLAVVGFWRRLKAGERNGVLIVLLLAPIPLLGVTSYGGEAVFRIFFFCLPFLAFFAAAVFFTSKSGTVKTATIARFGVVVVLMSIGFLLGNNGKDRQYWFSHEEVEAAWWLYSRSTPKTLLVEGARSYPSQFLHYENFTYVPISHESALERAEILENPAKVLDRWFSDARWNDGYVILTRSQQAYVEALGIMPKGALDGLAMALHSSPDFLLVYANRDARIFTSARFVKELQGMGE